MASQSAKKVESTFPIDEVPKYPAPGFTAPGAFAFSPDGKLLTYLFSPDGTLSRQLYALNLATGEQQLFVTPPDGGITEENVSREEALRRERQRQLFTGVAEYQWAPKGSRVLIPFSDGLYVQDGLGAPLRNVLVIADQPALDARFSPDGALIAYVQDAEVYVMPATGGEPRQVTSGARGTGKTNGLAEYAAQEEMGRAHGYWWSPDSKRIAFVEVDETHIPVYRIMHQGKDALGDDAQDDHHYPFAGQSNARVRLGIVPVDGGAPVWMDLGDAEYLARVKWMPDGRLTAQLENRDQTTLELVTFDLETGARSLILREESAVWINLHNLLLPLKASHPHYPGGFVWASERSGFQHLYLYDRDGHLIRQVTEGEWLVESASVDEKNDLVYFNATRESPRESHLYAVPLDGGEPCKISQAAGMHAVFFDSQFTRFVDVHDSLANPPSVSLRSLPDGKLERTVYENVDSRLAVVSLTPPELVTIQNRDGVTLYGAIYHPPQQFGKGPHPVIVSVYGGPHAQMVVDSWRMTAAMRTQYLRGLGYLVFVLDNRGSARRGLAFEGAIKHNMGDLEVQDQVDGVNWLVAQGLADPQRVGIYGWSYGGYMSAICLARASKTFKVAVAGAPVTHWDGYDTHYTERYMGTPQNNPEGYRASTVMAYVEDITGKLLLIHGLIDENVHFRHTARLINALIRARKPYDLMLFPDERHSPRRLQDRVFMEERIRDYFIENL